MIIFIFNHALGEYSRQISDSVVRDMNELANRILKNRKHVEQTLSEKVPYVEVILAEKPLSLPPRKPLPIPIPWVIHADPIDFSSRERLLGCKDKPPFLTLKHHLHFELDGRNFKNTDKIFVPFKILPAHILEKISKGNDEIDITEEINRELSDLNAIKATETD